MSARHSIASTSLTPSESVTVCSFLGLLVILYIQRTQLSCSVFPSSADLGKVFLLFFTASTLWIMLFAYLRLYSEVRERAQAGINKISDALEQDRAREADLRDATALLESVRSKDGVDELKKVVGGTGIIAIVGGLFWTYLLKQHLCVAAYLILPDWIVQHAA